MSTRMRWMPRPAGFMISSLALGTPPDGRTLGQGCQALISQTMPAAPVCQGLLEVFGLHRTTAESASAPITRERS